MKNQHAHNMTLNMSNLPSVNIDATFGLNFPTNCHSLYGTGSRAAAPDYKRECVCGVFCFVPIRLIIPILLTLTAG